MRELYSKTQAVDSRDIYKQGSDIVRSADAHDPDDSVVARGNDENSDNLVIIKGDKHCTWRSVTDLGEGSARRNMTCVVANHPAEDFGEDKNGNGVSVISRTDAFQMKEHCLT